MQENPAKILLIEDDKPIQNFLKSSLQSKGYKVLAVDSGEAGLSQAAMHVPDLVLLDLGLPDIDGIEVIARLREWSDLPILVLSAREKEKDKVEALDKGADDYMTKPFGLNELLARLRVMLRFSVRHHQPPEQSSYEVGDLKIDLVGRQIFKREEQIHLTAIEFKLLSSLARHQGKVLTQRYLLNEVWGPECVEHPQYLRVYMSALRRKLEDDTSRPEYILTEQGIGFRLADPAEAVNS